MKKYFTLVLCTVLSFWLITGCGSKNDNKKSDTNKENSVMEGSHQIDTCPNCFFSFNYSREMYYANYEENKRTNISILTDDAYIVTTDYNDVYDANGDKTDKWLGYVLDKDGYVVQGFVCATANDKTFCLEGSTDGSKYEENKKILKEVFDDDCVENTHYGEQFFTCGNPYGDHYEAISDGTVDIKTNISKCKAQSNGWIRCH